MTTDAELADEIERNGINGRDDFSIEVKEQIIAALRRQSQLEAMDAGSRRIIDEMGVELRKAQERGVNVAKSLGYAITLLEVEHDWDKCLQYLIAVRDKNDAAIKP